MVWRFGTAEYLDFSKSPWVWSRYFSWILSLFGLGFVDNFLRKLFWVDYFVHTHPSIVMVLRKVNFFVFVFLLSFLTPNTSVCLYV